MSYPFLIPVSMSVLPSNYQWPAPPPPFTCVCLFIDNSNPPLPCSPLFLHLHHHHHNAFTSPPPTLPPHIPHLSLQHLPLQNLCQGCTSLDSLKFVVTDLLETGVDLVKMCLWSLGYEDWMIRLFVRSTISVGWWATRGIKWRLLLVKGGRAEVGCKRNSIFPVKPGK